MVKNKADSKALCYTSESAWADVKVLRQDIIYTLYN